MTVPATIRAGTTVQWVEPPTVDLDGNAATSASWTLISYLRTRHRQRRRHCYRRGPCRWRVGHGDHRHHLERI
jgi:hypothetical protein